LRENDVCRMTFEYKIIIIKQLGEIWVKISGSIYKNMELDTNVHAVPPLPLRNLDLILNCCGDMPPIPCHKYVL
jgi:hypothetical protein